MEEEYNPARILKKISEAHMPLADIDEEWNKSWGELIDYLEQPAQLSDKSDSPSFTS